MNFTVNVRRLVSPAEALLAARWTVGATSLPVGIGEREQMWGRLLDAEHSPCRVATYAVEMRGIPYYVSVHLTRHKHGAEHFVTTQRTDRTGEERDGKRQDAPVSHLMVANAQALMNISRRRLCGKADPATREVWEEVVRKLGYVDAVLAARLVPTCKYRGGMCHEPKGCGRCKHA